MQSTNTWVSVICTCYNHGPFVQEAIESVLNQTHQEVELIVIDDHSDDDSNEKIRAIHTADNFTYIQNASRQGLCKNFNRGFKTSKGSFLIDLSADDILESDCIEQQIQLFQSLSPDYGVIYSNATLINSDGQLIKASLFDNDDSPATGDIYFDLIERCFIPTQTMIMRREVLEGIGGYDETLAYEDFDFWIRSSREWKYAYQPKPLTRIRKVEGSLSSKQYDQGDQQLNSTYQVCRKIKALNRDQYEDQALVRRLRYEIRHAILADKRDEAHLFLSLLDEMTSPSFTDYCLRLLLKSGIKMAWFRKLLISIES